MSETITIGIDLGTTNSSIAINSDGIIEIVKKPGGVEYTPSVFGFDKAKNKIVGQRAYESLYKDIADGEENNYKPEIKRVIGTPQKFYFERAGIEMSAEEISAEILKSLRQDVLRKYPNFDATAAVITIPAAFSVLQCEATKRAGNLAGFKHVVLLQEPIAAAISYGFATAKDETWLVYDLGGGTFDVALISSREGGRAAFHHHRWQTPSLARYSQLEKGTGAGGGEGRAAHPVSADRGRAAAVGAHGSRTLPGTDAVCIGSRFVTRHVRTYDTCGHVSAQTRDVDAGRFASIVRCAGAATYREAD
jgi:molecular chaperone DnaK (HSP70)